MMTQEGWLGRPASQWTAESLADLVGQQEGVRLEFKKASEFIRKGVLDRDELRKQLASTVSAFLNSVGGVLLLGVQTDKDPQKLDRKMELLRSLEAWTEEGSLDARGIDLSGSQISDLIHGNIDPPPMGIQVNTLQVPIGVDKATIHVISVPESPMGAHQSICEHRYFRRTGDGDFPMLDHEIRGVNARRAGPVLLAELHVTSADGKGNTSIRRGQLPGSYTTALYTYKDQVGAIEHCFFRLGVNLLNIGRNAAREARIDVGAPRTWISSAPNPVVGLYSSEGFRRNEVLTQLNSETLTVFFKQRHGSPVPIFWRTRKAIDQAVDWWTIYVRTDDTGLGPIWPGRQELHHISHIEFRPAIQAVNGTQWVPWRIMSDNMPEIRGATLLEISRTNGDEVWSYNYELGETTWAFGDESDEEFSRRKAEMGV